MQWGGFLQKLLKGLGVHFKAERGQKLLLNGAFKDALDLRKLAAV